jgi:stage II sporulation protein Q
MKEEQKQPIQLPKSKWKAFFSKKWTFPVIYMGAAALILASIMWYQGSRDFTLGKNELGPNVSLGDQQAAPKTQNTVNPEQTPAAVPVASKEEKMITPVAKDSEAKVVMNFYDEKANDKAKAAALIQYEDSYWPHTGVDFARKDAKTFDVVAALSGKVTKTQKDPMVGNLVEIQGANGITTVYESMEDVRVAVGDEVKQGDVLGKAGLNLFEKKLGSHVHFEVRENGQSVSPSKYLNDSQKEAK